MERVWPGLIVDENNLPAQITALRRAFGTNRDLIRTVPGRGYQFAGEVRAVSSAHDALPDAAAASVGSPTNLPEPASELIGREVELGEMLGLTATATAIRNALNPDRTVLARIRARVTLPATWQPADPLEPVLASPRFPTPMWRSLAAVSEELLLPGVGQAPGDTDRAQKVEGVLADPTGGLDLLLALDSCDPGVGDVTARLAVREGVRERVIE